MSCTRSHRAAGVTWSFLLLALTALVAAGCAGSDPESANYAALDPTPAGAGQPATSTTGTAGSAAPGSEPATAADSGESLDGSVEAEAIRETFDLFLARRARAITGDVELDELAEVATASAIDQVRALRDQNDDLAARGSYAEITALMEWSNISDLRVDGELISFVDCTERQRVTPGGATVVDFVTNEVVVVHDGVGFKVDTMRELQNGAFSTSLDEFGCVPPSFAERARGVAETAVAQAASFVEDPQAALDAELPPVFAGEARDDLERALQSLASQSLTRVADESVSITLLGMDVNRPDFTVVVSVCRTYPTGRSYLDADGAPTTSDLAVGSSYEEWLYVELEPVASGSETADAVVELADIGPNCQEGRP